MKDMLAQNELQWSIVVNAHVIILMDNSNDAFFFFFDK